MIANMPWKLQLHIGDASADCKYAKHDTQVQVRCAASQHEPGAPLVATQGDRHGSFQKEVQVHGPFGFGQAPLQSAEFLSPTDDAGRTGAPRLSHLRSFLECRHQGNQSSVIRCALRQDGNCGPVDECRRMPHQVVVAARNRKYLSFRPAPTL